MSLNKNNFEDAKKKARERISQWVEDAKSFGVNRIHDQYNYTFKRYHWSGKRAPSPKAYRRLPKIPPTLATTGQTTREKFTISDEKVKNKSKEIQSKSSKLEKCSDQTLKDQSHTASELQTRCQDPDFVIPERAHSRRTNSRLSRSRSRPKSRQTPERCQSSRHTPESKKNARESVSHSFVEPVVPKRSSLVASGGSEGCSTVADLADLTSKNEKDKDKLGSQDLPESYPFADCNILKVSPAEENSKILQHRKNRPWLKPDLFSPLNDKIYTGKNLRNFAIFPSNFNKRRPRYFYTEEFTQESDHEGNLGDGVSEGCQISQGTRTYHTDSRSITNTRMTAGSSRERPPTRGTPYGMNRSTPTTPFKYLNSFPNTANFCVKSKRISRRVHSSMKSSHGKRVEIVTNEAALERLSTPERERRRSQALRRFRVFVRKVMCTMAILRSSTKNVRKVHDSERLRARKKSKVLMAFDANYFSSAATSCGNLSMRSRIALCKLPHQRTETDIRILTEVMCRLAFLARYPWHVKEQLARIVWYDSYENGRIIIRQGDIGIRMYFVVTGTVAIYRTEKDPETGTTIVQHLRDIETGSTFGEIALIRDITRTYTAECKGECEFLSVGKDEFNQILRQTWEESWQKRMDFLNTSPHFKDWSYDQIRNTADMSIIKQYGTNQVIFGDQDQLTDWVYFVLKGQCELVRKVKVVRAKSPYQPCQLYPYGTKKSKYILENFLDKNYGKKLRKLRAENHFFTVRKLSHGDYFGVGEDMKNYYVISKSKTEIVLLNSASFSIHSKRDELEELRYKRNKILPSKTDLHRKFEINRNWMKYKANVVKDVVSRRSIPNTTSYTDVPVTLKLEPGIPWSLMKE